MSNHQVSSRGNRLVRPRICSIKGRQRLTCMHCTRLPFWTELNCWDFEVKRVADFSPEKALTEEDSREAATDDDATVTETGATTVEATAEAIAKISPHSNRKGNAANSLGTGDTEQDLVGTNSTRYVYMLGSAGACPELSSGTLLVTLSLRRRCMQSSPQLNIFSQQISPFLG